MRLSLAGTAGWLQGLGHRSPAVPVTEPDARGWTEEIAAPDGVLTVVSPPGRVDGVVRRWPGPAPAYGAAAPAWGDGGT